MSTTYFVEKIGRKKVAVIASVMGAVINGLAMIPVHWVYLFAMRVLVGIPSAALTTAVPSWMAELATMKQRGIVNVLFQLFVCFGIILSSLVLLGIGEHSEFWWISFLVTAAFCVFSAIALLFVPDQKTEKQEPDTPEISWKEFFTPKFRKVIINMFLLGIAQQATGINSVIVYATLSF